MDDAYVGRRPRLSPRPCKWKASLRQEKRIWPFGSRMKIRNIRQEVRPEEECCEGEIIIKALDARSHYESS